jgi:hypothetical protein
MHSIVPLSGRTLQNDLKIDNYLLPKGVSDTNNKALILIPLINSYFFD